MQIRFEALRAIYASGRRVWWNRGVALVFGWRTRMVALTSVPLLLGALSVHSGNGWPFTSANGGWVYPAFLVFAAVTVALLGDGVWALSAWRVPTKVR